MRYIANQHIYGVGFYYQIKEMKHQKSKGDTNAEETRQSEQKNTGRKKQMIHRKIPSSVTPLEESQLQVMNEEIYR